MTDQPAALVPVSHEAKAPAAHAEIDVKTEHKYPVIETLYAQRFTPYLSETVYVCFATYAINRLCRDGSVFSAVHKDRGFMLLLLQEELERCVKQLETIKTEAQRMKEIYRDMSYSATEEQNAYDEHLGVRIEKHFKLKDFFTSTLLAEELQTILDLWRTTAFIARLQYPVVPKDIIEILESFKAIMCITSCDSYLHAFNDLVKDFIGKKVVDAVSSSPDFLREFNDYISGCCWVQNKTDQHVIKFTETYELLKIMRNVCQTMVHEHYYG